MTQIKPRKAFLFKIEIAGLDQLEAQEVSGIGITVGVLEHGAGIRKIKTAGMESVEDVTLKKLRPLQASDTWAFDWVKDRSTRNVIVSEQNQAGVTLNRWALVGAFCSKWTLDTLSRENDANTFETVQISYTELIKL